MYLYIVAWFFRAWATIHSHVLAQSFHAAIVSTSASIKGNPLKFCRNLILES